jgi:hypothetical protein
MSNPMSSARYEKGLRNMLARNPNMFVPYYLMFAYLYYERGVSPVSDGFFDWMAKSMLQAWDSISHYHKDLITKDMLEAGTYIGTYPTIVQDAALQLGAAKGPRKRSRKVKT